jgi:hypothetical protein
MKSLFAGIPNMVARRDRGTRFRIWPELTNHCNFRCVYCPHSVYQKDSVGGNRFDRQKGYMSDELWGLVVENAAKYASYVGLGFFGEPLLHPRFWQYVKMIPKQRRYAFDLFTNWSLVTRENMEAMIALPALRSNRPTGGWMTITLSSTPVFRPQASWTCRECLATRHSPSYFLTAFRAVPSALLFSSRSSMLINLFTKMEVTALSVIGCCSWGSFSRSNSHSTPSSLE